MRQLSFAFIFLSLISCGQKSGNSNFIVNSDTIRNQAIKLTQSLQKRDINTFIEFTYPQIIEMFGSKQKAINEIEKSWEKAAVDTIQLVNIIVGQPSKVIHYNNEFQCTIPQRFEYKSPNARIIVKSTLIAISQDNEEKWYFIDAVGKNITKMKSIFKNLSSDLIIPEQTRPEIIKD